MKTSAPKIVPINVQLRVQVPCEPMPVFELWGHHLILVGYVTTETIKTAA